MRVNSAMEAMRGPFGSVVSVVAKVAHLNPYAGRMVAPGGRYEADMQTALDLSRRGLAYVADDEQEPEIEMSPSPVRAVETKEDLPPVVRRGPGRPRKVR